MANHRTGFLDRADALIGLGLLVFSCSGFARAESTDWFQTTTQALVDAVAVGDKSVWARVLDADCTITTEDGDVLDKRKFLDELKPLPVGFSGSIKVRGLTVKTAGSAAVVHYWLDELEDIFGQTLKTTYVETDVYRRALKSWKIVSQHVTVVPRDLEEIPVNRRDWQALVGEYRFSDKAASHYEVFIRDGTLYGGRDANTATLLIPLAPLVFFQKGSIHTMVFVQAEGGAVTEVRELHKYNEVIMRRVGAPPGR
jgi:uncharacterized protein DUF4440